MGRSYIHGADLESASIRVHLRLRRQLKFRDRDGDISPAAAARVGVGDVAATTDDKRHTAGYHLPMQLFTWSADKNARLMDERGISFEDVVYGIQQGALLDDLVHPNPEKYPDQRLFVVRVNNYAWLVPYVETETEIFLKTIIPSRKATRRYLRGRDG
jgi:uncharacterized DUF497 family protein